jgi:hypothetical protein
MPFLGIDLGAEYLFQSSAVLAGGCNLEVAIDLRPLHTTVALQKGGKLPGKLL